MRVCSLPSSSLSLVKIVPKLSTHGSYSLRKLWAISSRSVPSWLQRQIVPARQSVSLLVHLRPLPSDYCRFFTPVSPTLK